MKKVEQMTLDEMLNAGMSVEQIDAAIKERVATREKENAEAADTVKETTDNISVNKPENK